ncbi:MAG: hypothetical protein ABGZ53_29900 [Fuerstiella sp.]
MKKLVGIGMLVALVASVAGFSVAEMGEYLQVARNRAASTVTDSIPLDVEMDRMQVLLKKLDAQVGHQKYAVATSKIALQDAEANYSRSEARCQNLVAEMEQLRGLNMQSSSSQSCGTITVSCRSVSQSDIRRALSYKLAAWKAASATCKAQEQSVQQQRMAYTRLEDQFGQWQSQRSLLAQRLETLKTRHQTQQLASETNTSIFNNADLARAIELADQIERELRIVEAQQALGSDPTDSLRTPSDSTELSSIEAEVDAILGQQLAGN